MPEMPHGRRVLIMTAAMGGGHTQIARELQRRLDLRGHEARVVDMLDLMPRPTGRWLGRLYPWLVNSAPGLYDRIYDVFFVADQRAGERASIPVRLALPGLRRLVAQFAPDVVVSTYPLCALAVGRLRARGELSCPAITMITTFSVNNLWLHPAADLELCISADAAADVRARTGRPALVCGPVIRPGFREGPSRRAEARARLGLPQEGRVALVTTGSMGLSGSAERAAAAISACPGWSPVVVCGRNAALRTRLQQVTGAVVLGWVEDVPALLSAVDVMVDNNAGMSAKEALGFGLPVVTFRPLAGHGRDDARALARLGLTEVVTEEAELLPTLQRLVEDEDRLRDRVAGGRALFAGAAGGVLDPVEVLERFADGAARHGRRARPVEPRTRPRLAYRTSTHAGASLSGSRAPLPVIGRDGTADDGGLRPAVDQ